MTLVQQLQLLLDFLNREPGIGLLLEIYCRDEIRIIQRQIREKHVDAGELRAVADRLAVYAAYFYTQKGAKSGVFL